MARIIVSFGAKAFKRHSDVEISVSDDPPRWRNFDSGGVAFNAVVENEIPVSTAQFEVLNGLIEGGIAFEIDDAGKVTIVEDDQ